MEVTGTRVQPRTASSEAPAETAPATSPGTAPARSAGDPEVEALVARSRDGDREAFSELVVRFQDVVYNIIHQRLGDADASLDAAQEAFVKAYSGLSKFRGESSFKCWLLTISLREAENQRRKRKRQLPAGELAGVDPPAHEPAPGSWLEVSDDVASVRRALAEADEHDAQLILLRDVEDLSYQEIADALGVALGTVKSGLSRARARLRAALEQPQGARKAGEERLP